MSGQTNRWCSPSREREIALDDDIVPINDYLNGPDWWYDGLQEIQNFFPDPEPSQHVDGRNDTSKSASTSIVGETAGSLEPSNLHNAFATPDREVSSTIVPLPQQTEERMCDVQFQLLKDPQHVYVNESMVSSPPSNREVGPLANETIGHKFLLEPSPLPETSSSHSNDKETQSFSQIEDAMLIDSGNLAPTSTPSTNYNKVREVGEQSHHHQPSLQGFNSATSTGEVYNDLALEPNASSQTSFTCRQASPGHGQAESHSLPSRSRVHLKYDNGFPPFPYTDTAPASDYENDDDRDQLTPKQSTSELDSEQGVPEQITPSVISSNVTTGAPSPRFITKDGVAGTHVPNRHDKEASPHVSSTASDFLTNSFGTVPDNSHVVVTGPNVDLRKTGETRDTSRPVIFKPYIKASLGKDLSVSSPVTDTIVPSIDEVEKVLPAGSTISLAHKRIGATFANREQSPLKKLKLDEESESKEARIDSDSPISASSEREQDNRDAMEDKMDIDALTESSMPTAYGVRPERIEGFDTIETSDPALEKVPSIIIPVQPHVEVRISPNSDSIPPRSSTAPTIQDRAGRAPSSGSVTEKPVALAAKPNSIHEEDTKIMPPPLSTAAKATQQPDAETTRSKTRRPVSDRAMQSLVPMEAPTFSPPTPGFPPGSFSIAPIQNDSASDSSTGRQPPPSAAVTSEDISNLSPAVATPIARPKRGQISLRELTSLAPDGGFVQSDTPARRLTTTVTGVPTTTSSRRSMTPRMTAGSQRSAISSTVVPTVATTTASSRRSSSSSLSSISTPVLEFAQLPNKGKCRTDPPRSLEKGHSRAKQTEVEDETNQGGVNLGGREFNSMRLLNLPRSGNNITSTPGYGLVGSSSITKTPRKTTTSRVSAADEQDQLSPQQKGALTKKRNAQAKAAAAEVKGLSAQQKGALTKKRNAAAAAAEEEELSTQQKGVSTKKRNALAAASETDTPVPVTPSKSKSKARSAASKVDLGSSTDIPSSMITNSRPKRTTSGARSAYSAPEEADEDSEDEFQSSIKRPVRRSGASRNMLKELGISPSQVSDSPVQTRRSSAANFESGGDWASGLRRNLARRNADERATNQDDEVDDLASPNTSLTTVGDAGSGKDKGKKRDTRRGAA